MSHTYLLVLVSVTSTKIWDFEVDQVILGDSKEFLGLLSIERNNRQDFNQVLMRQGAIQVSIWEQSILGRTISTRP